MQKVQKIGGKTQNLTQVQIQAQIRQERMLDKANELVASGKVRRSQCNDTRNLWFVSSYSTPKKWYVVKWSQERDVFECGCKSYEYSTEAICLHIAACAIYEGLNR